MGLRPGVHNVMATPFTEDEALDLESVGTLIDYLAAAGVDGVLVLGVLGEADRVSDVERKALVEATLKHAAGRLQVTVGITHGSTVVVKQRAREAAEMGADAVMISPPPGTTPGAALHDLFRRASDGLRIPVVVQDHPASSGVKMSAEFIARLEPDLPPESVVKLEDPPTGPKIVRLRQAAGMYRIFGGLGGVNLIAELEAGSDGTMTGFALPELLVGIVRSFLAKDRAKARARFNAALPLITFEAQPGAGVGLRKEVLRRRGAIRFATVREPATAPSQVLLEELDRVLAPM